MDAFIEKINENKIENVLDFFRNFDPFSYLKHNTDWQNEFKQVILSHRNGDQKLSDVVCSWLYNDNDMEV